MRNKKKVSERNPTMEKQSDYKAVAVSIPLSKPVAWHPRTAWALYNMPLKVHTQHNKHI
jgi:hypothetical protein